MAALKNSINIPVMFRRRAGPHKRKKGDMKETNGNTHRIIHRQGAKSPATKNRTRSSQFFLFARIFLKHPSTVGWLMPSSPFLVDEVLKQIDWQRARVLVEYGPGMGAFTSKLLERMRPDATLIALEVNPQFCRFLKESLHDPRLHVLQESATEIDSVMNRMGFSHADYVISGIPFKTISHGMRDAIVRKTHSILSSNGSFLVYQFSDAVRPYLERVFRQVSRDFELLNILPARLFFCAR